MRVFAKPTEDPAGRHLAIQAPKHPKPSSEGSDLSHEKMKGKCPISPAQFLPSSPRIYHFANYMPSINICNIESDYMCIQCKKGSFSGKKKKKNLFFTRVSHFVLCNFQLRIPKICSKHCFTAVSYILIAHITPLSASYGRDSAPRAKAQIQV